MKLSEQISHCFLRLVQVLTYLCKALLLVNMSIYPEVNLLDDQRALVQISPTKAANAIESITRYSPAREGQIKAVVALSKGRDVMLVAATGYGKSAPQYAFAALQGKITICFVPLIKLGKEQVEDIMKNVRDARPVWVDSDSHVQVSLVA